MREEALSAHDEVLILASDGLWDVLTNQDAVNLIKDIPVRAAVPPCCPWGNDSRGALSSGAFEHTNPVLAANACVGSKETRAARTGFSFPAVRGQDQLLVDL